MEDYEKVVKVCDEIICLEENKINNFFLECLVI